MFWRNVVTLAARAFAVVAFAAGLCGAGEAGGRLRTVADPAEALAPDGLSEAEKVRFAELAERLAGDDFDARQKAQAALLDYGPRAAPWVKALESSADVEVREFAKSFQAGLAFRYHGYLPTAPEIRNALNVTRRFFIGKQETFRDALERALRNSELQAAFDWKRFPERIVGDDQTTEFTAPAREALARLLLPVGLIAVPRGARLAVMTPERAKELEFQEHTFVCASLTPTQRDTLAADLTTWMPPGSDVRATATGLRVAGRESTLRIAARTLYCLAPESLNLSPSAASEAVFPKPPEFAAVEAVFKTLATPVPDLNAQGIEPLRVLALLRSNGYPVVVDLESAAVSAQPAVGVHLTGLPLGLDLQWLTARANKPKKNEETVRLGLTVRMGTPESAVASPHIVARFRLLGQEAESSESVGYADVSFVLDDAARRVPATAAKAAHEALHAALDDEIALYPCEENDCAWQVFERRLLVRGPPLVVARVVRLIANWRSTGVPPRAAWRVELERQLHQEIDWDGRNATPRTLVPQLREITGLNILLEREDESAPSFVIEAAQAELLPPGKRRAEELLQRLAEVAKAKWSVKRGAVVLTKGQ